MCVTIARPPRRRASFIAARLLHWLHLLEAPLVLRTGPLLILNKEKEVVQPREHLFLQCPDMKRVVSLPKKEQLCHGVSLSTCIPPDDQTNTSGQERHWRAPPMVTD